MKELECQKKQRNYRYISLAAVAACFIIIISMGIAMPRVIAGLSRGKYTNTGMMASIFYEGKVFGYVLVGLLSFALGVCLTVLCFLLQPGRQRNKEDHNHDRNHRQ